MAYEEAIRSITLKANSTVAAFTGVPGQPGSADPNGGKQYYFVKATSTAGTCGLADATANELVLGVLQNKPQYDTQAATVAIRGVSKVVAGTGGVAAGDAIKVDGTIDGTGVTATLPADAALVVGIALGAASAGALFPCLLRI
jgi:hypothetical protein